MCVCYPSPGAGAEEGRNKEVPRAHWSSSLASVGAVGSERLLEVGS